MEVSKITLTEATRQQLQNPTLGRSKRRELRRALIIDYIKSRPNGSEFTTKQINRAAFPRGHTANNVLRFVKDMERDKLIDIEATPNSYKYVITVRDAKTTKQPAAPKVAPAQKKQPDADHQTTADSQPSFGDIESLARRFAWEQNSNDLRDFIKWAKVEAIDRMSGRRGKNA